MVTYRPMKCRDCGTEIVPSPDTVSEPTKAECYSDCYFKCPYPTCQVAYSNARDEQSRTKIYRTLEGNVPGPVRDGLLEVLGRSLNVSSRPKKQLRFGFETSEDAVTWTVFRYLLGSGEVGPALGIEGLNLERALFWGCPWPPDATHPACSLLEEIQLQVLQENPVYLSEPDVILIGLGLLVFVEVKYREVNSSEPFYRHFNRYLQHRQGLFTSTPAVEQAGYYELVRNLVIGSLLATQLNRPFLLVNLGDTPCLPSAQAFQRLLVDPSLFRFVSWSDLVGRLQQPVEQWFADYLRTRRLR
jgi:hypothetical protein